MRNTSAQNVFLPFLFELEKLLLTWFANWHLNTCLETNCLAFFSLDDCTMIETRLYHLPQKKAREQVASSNTKRNNYVHSPVGWIFAACTLCGNWKKCCFQSASWRFSGAYNWMCIWNMINIKLFNVFSKILIMLNVKPNDFG